MRRTENVKTIGKLQPYEYFDVIAGTGTGGISACMLGRLRMSVEMAIEEYAKLVKEVFKEKKLGGRTMYKQTKLEEALKALIRKATGDEGEKMNQGQDNSGCKTMVFAMARHNLNAGLPVMFRSYTATTNPGPDCAIWEAVCATMAHPDLFKGVDIVESGVVQSFIGGELGCSNPLGHVLAEVKRVYPGHQVGCIVSIGAGHARTIRMPNPVWWNRAQDVMVMRDMATDSERVAEEMALRFEGASGVYFRFDVDHGMQDMKDGSWEKLGEAMQHTRAYLQKSETNRKLQDLTRVSEAQPELRAITTAQAAGQMVAVREPEELVQYMRCPAPTKFYTGREDENTRVIACITGGRNERRVCVVFGLGGVGKTQLVLNVISRTWDEWDHIIYVEASSQEAIEKALKEYAGAKNIGQAHLDVINWLESCGERWLLVFDNADNPTTNIQQYIPARDRGGSVLITTRLPDLGTLAEGPNSVCQLSGMSHADGTALLVKIASSRNQQMSDEARDAAQGLVKEFGGLALAITHAAHA
ncbi:unnamed protein product [Rhizoctonia solani]|uniref:PNPLA domain-containing protein n=1 Tax=Rhizoctonia solani TaxID=456999 RepID=A0A8H3ATY0_9AGAM|nr:unnamed protein product [Rhizoctonia solani]